MAKELDDQEAQRVILRRMHQGSRPYVGHCSWCTDPADAASICNHGSWFALMIGDKLFGVTAAHVVRDYLRDKAAVPETTFRLQDVDFPIENRLIELGRTREETETPIDIATFNITPDEIARMEKQAWQCRPSDWPCRPLQDGEGIVLTGYPSRDVKDRSTVEIHQCSNALHVERITLAQATIRVESQHLGSIDGEQMPPLNASVGGYSGAPILGTSENPAGLYRVCGVLSEGKRFDREGSECLDFTAELGSRIGADGRLRTGTI